MLFKIITLAYNEFIILTYNIYHIKYRNITIVSCLCKPRIVYLDGIDTAIYIYIYIACIIPCFKSVCFDSPHIQQLNLNFKLD